jgi:hypothetical protein
MEYWNDGFGKDRLSLPKLHHSKLNKFVKSPQPGHCEERSDEAISLNQRVKGYSIASLRSQ